MNNLAPRQGIFAVILLVSLCLHLLILMISMEKQQYDYRTEKGEKIVEQLSKEALVAVANQDRISLSVLANRYQVDKDVVRLAIYGTSQQPLVQIGVAQNEEGELIEQPIIQNNSQIGKINLTMRAPANGEVLAEQWIFLLGAVVLHIFLWLMYRLTARPTKKQLEEIGENLQQRLIITRQGLLKQQQLADEMNAKADANEEKKSSKMGLNIQNYLQKSRNVSSDNQQEPLQEVHVENQNEPAPQTQSQTQHQPILKNFGQNDEQNFIKISSPISENVRTSVPYEHEVAVQIGFFDEFNLLSRLSPEVAEPYLHLCEQLLLRACDKLFIAHEMVADFSVKSVNLKHLPQFNRKGAIVHLTGKNEEVILASILLSKLVLILNQVVYEKHRELSRFALPMSAGVSTIKQVEDMERLMKNHSKEDGLLILYPKNLLKFLDKNVQFKHTNQPMNISEREMVRYNGLSQVLMKDLIAKRDEILTSTER